MSKRVTPEVACICCGTVGNHAARGLIKPCYSKHRAAGTLDQFKPLQASATSLNEVAIPLTVLGALLVAAESAVEEWAEQQLGVELVTRAINAAEAAELAVPA